AGAGGGAAPVRGRRPRRADRPRPPGRGGADVLREALATLNDARRMGHGGERTAAAACGAAGRGRRRPGRGGAGRAPGRGGQRQEAARGAAALRRGAPPAHRRRRGGGAARLDALPVVPQMKVRRTKDEVRKKTGTGVCLFSYFVLRTSYFQEGRSAAHR